MMHENKIYFITGSSSGIALATAKLLFERGASIAGFDWNRERNEREMNRLDPRGERVLALTGNVAEENDLQAAYEQALEKFGKLHGVVACAGINGTWAALQDLAVEDWDQTQQVNLRGSFLTLKHAIAPLRANDGGSIVLVSSINGPIQKNATGATAYACSKSGQVTLGEKAAVELARYKIRVNTVLPGAVRTNIRTTASWQHLEKIKYRQLVPYDTAHPLLKRVGYPEEVAGPIAFLLSDDARFVSGTGLVVDGLQSVTGY
jgi:NAD(P)-dependent dehydrogenase (short-subunit alcohol dehydrogenase family)